MTTEHDDDQVWRDAYSIAWVGACNARAVARTLTHYRDTYGANHPAVRAIAGHLAFLDHESLGPEFADLDAVVENGRRLGIHHG
jgi:hypothetical protein